MQDGTRLENIKSSDVQEALTVIGEPAAIVDKVRQMMESLFPNKSPTYREFVSFLRFGKVAESKPIPKKRKPKPPTMLDRELVNLYEHGTKIVSPRVDNRVHLKAPMSRLPAVTLSGPRPNSKPVPSSVESAYLRRSTPATASNDALSSGSATGVAPGRSLAAHDAPAQFPSTELFHMGTL